MVSSYKGSIIILFKKQISVIEHQKDVFFEEKRYIRDSGKKTAHVNAITISKAMTLLHRLQRRL